MINIVYLTIVILSIVLIVYHYINETFAFNAELIVAICFIVFVTLTYKNINNMLTAGMKERAEEIKEEYNTLHNNHKQNLKILIDYYKKYQELINNLKELFIYTVSKSYEMYQERRNSSLNKAYSLILKGFTTIQQLENIYILKYKYYFILRYYNKLENYYSNNNNLLLEYLNNINYIANINKN